MLSKAYEIISLYTDGKSIFEISDVTGYSLTEIQTILQDEGYGPNQDLQRI